MPVSRSEDSRLHPFSIRPPRTVLATFKAHGSPVTLSAGGKYRFGDSHTSTYPFLPSGSPVPLRHVSSFPGLELLWGLRRHGARALEAILNFSGVVRDSMI